MDRGTGDGHTQGKEDQPTRIGEMNAKGGTLREIRDVDDQSNVLQRIPEWQTVMTSTELKKNMGP